LWRTSAKRFVRCAIVKNENTTVVKSYQKADNKCRAGFELLKISHLSQSWGAIGQTMSGITINSLATNLHFSSLAIQTFCFYDPAKETVLILSDGGDS